MNPTKSASYRRPRESGGPGQQYRHINYLASTSGRRFAARPWVPAFAGTTTEIQHIGKHQFISGQALRRRDAPSRRTLDSDPALPLIRRFLLRRADKFFAHRDEFLGGRRVDADCLVEHPLGGAAFDRD